MRDRLLDRDPVCIHEISVYQDCDKCEVECSGSLPSNDMHVNQTVLSDAICPHCNKVIVFLQQLLTSNNKEEPATDG